MFAHCQRHLCRKLAGPDTRRSLPELGSDFRDTLVGFSDEMGMWTIVTRRGAR